MTARDVSVSTLWAVNRPPLQVWSPCSEDEFNSQLNTPRASRSQDRVASEYIRSLRHRSELARTTVAGSRQAQVCRGGEGPRRSVDIRMVEDVEELAAKLCRERFGELLILAHCYIRAPVTRTAKKVPGCVAKRAQGRRSHYGVSLHPAAECRESGLGCRVSCAKRVVDGHIGRHVRYARAGIDSRERRAWRRRAGREKLWDIRRSEEHTSELQSRYVISYAVICLKKKIIYLRHSCVSSRLTDLRSRKLHCD